MPLTLKNRPELSPYLPPDLVTAAQKQLAARLSEAAQRQDLGLLGLVNILVSGELDFRSQVIPVGETEVERLKQLTQELKGQIGEATQNFGALAATAGDQDLLTARNSFKQQTADLQQRLNQADIVGGKIREVVGALTDDVKSGRVILGYVAGLEKKGADLPAIVAGALLRSLFEPEEGTTTGIPAAAGADFITASRQAVVASTSRRAEFAPSEQTETVVKISRVQRVKTPSVKARLGVKDLLEAEGIDTGSLKPIDLAHIAKALPGATKQIFNVEATVETMAETLLAIARQEAGPDQFGKAASLRKLYGLGGQTSGTPPAIISKVMVPEEIKPPDKPDKLEVATKQAGSRQFLVRENTPLAAVFSFEKDKRWSSKNWGLLAHQATGTSRARDEAGKKMRSRQKQQMRAGLEDQIDKLLVACKSKGLVTVAQLVQSDGVNIPDEMKSFLEDLIVPDPGQQAGSLPINVLAQLPDAINIPDGVPTKPRNKDDLLKFLRKQKS